MKAVQMNRYGGPEVLEFTDVPKPVIGKDQILVENYAASINPIDWKVRAGYLKEMVPLKFPVTLGVDFAGKVVEVGEGVTDFKVNDEVYGQGGILNGGSGTLAEFVVAPINKSSKKPQNIDYVQAAALPLAGISALQALEDHIHLKSKQQILIHGGAGGIGHLAIQIAKALGAYVATTVSSDDAEYVKSLGADEIIGYKKEKFEEKLNDFDAVFDTVGGETTHKSFNVLKKAGILVSMLGQPNLELAKKYGVRVIGQNTDSTPDRLQRLTKLVENGAIKVHVDKTFPLERTQEAFTYLEKSHPRGKMVLNIKD